MHRFISAIKRRCGAWRNRRGAVAVEFAFLFPIALVFTFGLIEFALILFDFHRLSEATRRGARAAIIQPAISDLANLSAAGSPYECTANATSTAPYSVTCSVGPGPSADADDIFETIITDMQGIKPDLMGSNITITYTDTGVTGGEETPGLMTPMVTVSISGFQYSYFVLTLVDDLLGLSGASGTDFSSSTTFSFPDFATSRVGPTQNAS